MDIAEVILAGLEAPMTSEERDAWRTPPYRLPPSLVPLQQWLLTELGAHLPGDGDAGAAHQDVTTRVRSSPIELRSLARRLWRAESFDVADTACALLAAGVLHASAAERIAGRLPPYSGFRRQLVRNSLATGDLVSAGEHAAAMGPNAWVGYREIGAAHAAAGDAVAFFAGWKRYNAREARNHLAELKRTLVSAVAHRQGWPAALAVTNDRRIGPEFALYAFDAEADVDALLALFSGDAADVLTPTDELVVLARAVRAATPRNPEHDHPRLAEILDRILAVPPSTKDTTRWRDGQLFRLWPAIGEQSTLDRVRKAVRAPSIKRELQVLARDL
jgi:hypothetical protein